MEPKQRKGQKAEFFRRCCKRVKCFVGKLMILLLLVTRPKGFLRWYLDSFWNWFLLATSVSWKTRKNSLGYLQTCVQLHIYLECLVLYILVLVCLQSTNLHNPHWKLFLVDPHVMLLHACFNRLNVAVVSAVWILLL